MITQTIPAGISVLQVVAHSLDNSTDLFTRNHTQLSEFKNKLNANLPINDWLKTNHTAEAISFIQALLMASISMKGNVFVPMLYSVELTNKSVSIKWFSSITDKFSIGKFDKDIEYFVESVNRKIFQTNSNTKQITKQLLINCKNNIQKFSDITNESFLKFNQMLMLIDKYPSKLLENIQKEDLFILLSLLSADQLNALFLHITRYLPTDFNIKIENNRMVSVVKLFESPSDDIVYLIEKVKIYFELYYQSNDPLIAEITQKQTNNFVQNLLINNQLRDDIKERIQQLIDQQFKLRLTLFSQLIDCCSKVDI